MDIPASGLQLLVLLLFVVPGSVYQAVRQRLRGPTPDDLNFSNKLFRAVGVSTALMAIYVALFGPFLLHLTESRADIYPTWRGTQQHAAEIGWIGVLLLLGIPALLGLLDFVRVSRGWSFNKLTYDPTPRAWDYAFKDIEPCYVRVLTDDGVWLGGWFGPQSFISSFPEPREMYIETAHEMASDGSIGQEQPWSAGIYIRCDDIRAVELLRQPLPSNEDEGRNDDGDS